MEDILAPGPLSRSQTGVPGPQALSPPPPSFPYSVPPSSPLPFCTIDGDRQEATPPPCPPSSTEHRAVTGGCFHCCDTLLSKLPFDSVTWGSARGHLPDNRTNHFRASHGPAFHGLKGFSGSRLSWDMDPSSAFWVTPMPAPQRGRPSGRGREWSPGPSEAALHGHASGTSPTCCSVSSRPSPLQPSPLEQGVQQRPG